MLALAQTGGGSSPTWLFFQSGKWSPCSFQEGLEKLSHAPAENPRPDFSLPEGLLPPFGGTKILCVGRNYRPHVEELGNPLPKEPLWFTKPPSSLQSSGGRIILPRGFGRIDLEGEVALVIGKRCKCISQETAAENIAGVTLALDITARELQKADGQWTRAKGFDTFCPLGPVIIPWTNKCLDSALRTELNGKIVQDDRTGNMIFPIPKLVAHISDCMTLEPGDLILTGTPAGVCPIASGDKLRVFSVDRPELVLEAEVA